ncbi:hypothetical protein [Streptomyces melanogenes]
MLTTAHEVLTSSRPVVFTAFGWGIAADLTANGHRPPWRRRRTP